MEKTIFKYKKIQLVLAGLFVIVTAYPQSTKKSMTPIMGWASWNYYSVRINDSIIKQQADSMVSTGLSTVGYKYINIDDGFFNGRYPDGTFRIDTIKFPKGMKPAAAAPIPNKINGNIIAKLPSPLCSPCKCASLFQKIEKYKRNI